MSGTVWALKLIIIGDGRVGKTSIRRSYMGEKFEQNYINTIGADFSFKEFKIDDAEVSVSIWDLAGQDTYHKIHPQYYAGTSGVMIVYDITNQNSLQNVEMWLEKFSKYSEYQDTPVLIIGNKSDLIKDGEQEIAKQRHQDLIQQIRSTHGKRISISEILTSAKTGSGIENGFSTLVMEIMTSRLPSLGKPLSAYKTIDDIIPSAYFIIFDDLFGPRIVGRHPVVLKSTPGFSDKEFGSAIKISSVIDLQDVIDHTQITGSFTWNDPSGIFRYIGFSREVKDGNQLLILGFVCRMEYDPLVLQHDSLVNGYLHNIMNELVTKIEIENIDLTSHDLITTRTSGKNTEFSEILFTFRKYIFDLLIFSP